MPPALVPRAAADDEVRPATSRLTLKHVADALGVSRTTVSNAYNRPERLSEALRSNIFAKARQLGYFGPDPMARALRRRELQTVGVVFHHDMHYALSDATTRALLGGIAGELDRRRLWMQFIPRMGRKLLLATAFQSTADAMIIHSEIGPEFMHEVTATPKPVVLVDAQVPGIAAVRTDDRRGAMLAMRHALAAAPDVVVVLGFLVGAGERERVLGKLRPPPSGYVGSERIAGYGLAARAAGFPLAQIRWLDVDDQWPETAGDHLRELLHGLNPQARVALVAMSDRLALAAMATFVQARGARPVAVVGFDDIPAAAAAGLTTIRQDSARKGALAVQVLLDGLASVTLPVELVLRET